MTAFTVLSPVARGAGDHQPGETIDLDADEAEALLAAGVIEPHQDTEPAHAPASPGLPGDAAGGSAQAAGADDAAPAVVRGKAKGGAR